MAWKEVGGGQYVPWDEPKAVEGRLTQFLQKETQYGQNWEAWIEQDDGQEVWFYCPAALASRLQKVAIGTKVRVEFTGNYVKSKQGRPVKEFKVYTDEE